VTELACSTKDAERKMMQLLSAHFRWPTSLGFQVTDRTGYCVVPDDMRRHKIEVFVHRESFPLDVIVIECSPAAAVQLAHDLNRNGVVRYESGVVNIAEL
jgi:hypothetical protein